MDVDLHGRVAFVTGAAGAIGRATARRLADCGAAIVVADIDGDGAEASPRRCREAIGVTVDIRDAAAVERAVSATLDAFGRLDILVNNAGVNTFRDRVDIDAFPAEEWHRIVGIDLDGLYRRQQGRVAADARTSGEGASSTSPRWSASPRCGCRAPSSPPRPA